MICSSVCSKFFIMQVFIHSTGIEPLFSWPQSYWQSKIPPPRNAVLVLDSKSNLFSFSLHLSRVFTQHTSLSFIQSVLQMALRRTWLLSKAKRKKHNSCREVDDPCQMTVPALQINIFRWSSQMQS